LHIYLGRLLALLHFSCSLVKFGGRRPSGHLVVFGYEKDISNTCKVIDVLGN
jgi:hypothetical protein